MHIMDDHDPDLASSGRDHEDRLLDAALARLAGRAADPAPGFPGRVMARVTQVQALGAFARLLRHDRALAQQCRAIGSRDELVQWLHGTAQRHRIDAAPMLAQVDRYFTGANDGQLDDAALDAVVGAGTPGAHYLEGLLGVFADPD
jgi:hypothetical protein